MLRHVVPPSWVYLGGLVLAMTAGVINAVGLLGAHHQALSHLTGTVTTVGLGLGQGHYAVAGHAVAILGGFFLGCVVSGAIVQQHSLRLGRRYGVALALESAALFLAVYFLRRGTGLGECLAAFACGLQNAMVTTYSNSGMRTTHMTGMVTDLGIACGHLLRGIPVDWFRFRIYGVLLLGFFAGGLAGAVAYGHFGSDTLLLPAGLSGAAGLGYTAISHFRARA